MTTYEIIRKLPGKGFNWAGFVSALRAEYVAVCDPQERDNLRVLCRWDVAKGARQLRDTAMEMACSIVERKAQRSKFIGASPETLAWGGFLGGETVVWTDQDAKSQATAWVADLAGRMAA